ncbi:MAG: hypothetical protein ACJ75T_09955 [Solirubrobacterales bacterium]
MTLKQARRPRNGMVWLALALGALALLALPSLAAAKDRNHDRIPDRWEKRHKLSLKTNQARLDQDRDHLRNRAEFLAGDDPRDHDSDDDGVMDGSEQAGTIASFDTESGRLTINLFGGDTISGLVDESTEIKCEDNGSSASASDSGSGSGEEESGDDHGGEGEEEPGDDHGGQGQEPGDDNGGEGEHGDDNSGPGSANSGPGHDGDDDHGARLCTTAELVPGAVVEEAELNLTNGQAVFHEVELSGKEVSSS